MTRGLVGDTAFAVLPEITKEYTFGLTFVFQAVSLPHPWANLTYITTKEDYETNYIQLCLVKLWFQPDWDTFVGAVTNCAFAAFLFGWHVHEKAVLLIIIPFSLLALKDRRYLGAFRPLAVAGHVSLFPLLFTAAEFPVKTVYTIFWLVLFLFVFGRLAPAPLRPRVFLLDRFSLLYDTVSIPLIVYCSLVHGIVFGKRYEFLPLMFTSAYAAVGVLGSWAGFMVVYFTT